MLTLPAGQCKLAERPGGDWGNAMQRPIERPWLQHYPPGVPADIDTTRYPSLVAMFEESFKANAAREACVCMGKTLTFAELDPASRAFAAWLQSKGLQRGARVAIMMPNVLQYPVAIAGILRAGLTARERQSAVQAARTGIPAQGLRRRSHRRAGEFRRGAAGGVAAHATSSTW